ncbi:hypothetical protein AB0K60_21715 [Thermopolyspora sp. NPDC052614]|uniref:hypothetical protein n=1 Tax=Thermopolyspora sp. NPDC052614 TaxID=3155682 RepID=UPI003415D3B4
MVNVAERAQVRLPGTGRGTRLRAFLLRHPHLTVAMGLAAVLRLVTMLGYRPAMWFNDSYEYVSVALHPRPHPIRPDGYGFWLLLLKPFHSFSLVVFTQHLMGLATAVLIYALLIRKFDLPGWAATLTVSPVLFDAYQIQLEHLVMSDTMFTLLVVGVVTLILWHRRLSTRMGVVVGLLLALTALTRTVGLPIMALVVVYLLVKRVGWRPIAAVVVATAVPVVAYMAWFNSAYGRFAMTNSDGLIMYMRTMAFADCNKIKPKEVQLIVLCTTQRKDYSQWYLWDPSGPPHRYGTPKFDEDVNEWASKFATQAILAQPGDYLAVVARDFFRAFRWDRPVFPDANTYNQYEFRNEEKPLPTWALYKGRADTDAVAYEQGRAATQIVGPWANVMQGYQRVVHLPGLILGIILLIGLYGVAVRWRKLGGPVMLPWLAAVGLILAPAATAEFDYRYLLPAVPLACLAAAITLRRGVPLPAFAAARLAARRPSAQNGDPNGDRSDETATPELVGARSMPLAAPILDDREDGDGHNKPGPEEPPRQAPALDPTSDPTRP